MKLSKLGLILLCLTATCFGAKEMLFGNNAFAAGPAGSPGKLWVFSSDVFSGVALLELKTSSMGISVVSSEQEPFSEDLSAIHAPYFSDVRAEYRRVPSVYAGKLNLVFPMYGVNKQGVYTKPEGIFSLRGARAGSRVVESKLSLPEALEEIDTTMHYAVTGLAYDSLQQKLWIARGLAGITRYDASMKGETFEEGTFVLNRESKTLDSVRSNTKFDVKKTPFIYGVAVHPKTSELWLATSKGLWKGKNGSFSSASKLLDTMRVSGIWMGGNPFQIIVETSSSDDESVKGQIYRSFGDGFKKIPFINADGKVQKKDVFDKEDYTVTNIAFVDDEAFIAVRAVGGTVSGLLRLDSVGIQAYDVDEDNENKWLYDSEYGVTDRKVQITSVTSFPLTSSITGLAITTYGNGISVSADKGRSWTPILNRARLDNNLGSIRMVPSVIGAGGESLVSYKVGKDSKITIEVFSYDMKKVRTIVKDAPRLKDESRSTNAKEDLWDGRDEYGRDCTMGMYYVRVKDNHGHVGWGKVMSIGGNN